MDERGDTSLGWLLTESLYRRLEDEFAAGRFSVYMLAGPLPVSGRLAEFHRVGDAYHSLEIAYGPWPSSRNLLRVVTVHDVPGQEEITPENYLGFRAVEARAAVADVDGHRVTGTLGTAGRSWVWSATVRDSRLIVTGRGEWRKLSLTSAGDFADAIANGKACARRDFRRP